ncbi:VanW family protein [Ornithinimicrobium pekingense]|uniref:Vanomycin resistance protein VanB n=1 Tax=Ornithinimicrobium pekingense TaxID=384677 RepID=A0ABQ2F641_9MICO|nr:VanW family protein [Ornithinimicrobium pekingense]GGK65725.1 vanomycin resistance protein VanB [Ornithinimicrobium pekingense]
MSQTDTRPDRLREEDGGGPGREWVSVVLRLLAAVVVLGGAYVGTALYFADRPPAGMSVEGVDIGSMTRDQAVAHLEQELVPRLQEPLTVTVEAQDEEGSPEELALVPAESGLSYDLDATLEGAVGRSFDPRVLWAHVSGSGRELELVGAVDREALTAAVGALAQEYDAEAVEGEVSITEQGVEVVEAGSGRTLDVPATVEAVAAAWPEQEAVEGSASSVAPALTAEEVERFRGEQVEPALSAPVKVTATRGEDSVTAEVAPREIAEMLSVERSEDQASLSLVLDEEALLARVRQDLGQLERGPRDATVRLEGSEVAVVPARTGFALDEEGLPDAFRQALTAEGEDRTITLELEEIEPAIPTAASEGWTFGTMSRFESVFPTGELNAPRTANLTAGVRNVNGTVVMPGEQFRLSQALGDLSKAGGYVEAPIIQDGRLVMGLGGGLSQVSTVVFNAAWSAGVQLDEHTPHSFYIARYPAGREATLAVPVIDNAWTNDTDNPIVVRSWITGDTIVMELLGERQYDVRTIDGQWRDRTTGERTVDDSPECVPQNPAEGFTVTTVRILSSGGREVGRDEFTTTYQPADEIICTHPDAGY